MWVEKYRPKSFSEYRGASNQKKELKEWAENWKQGDKPVLLHGQPGTGKTSLVEVLAKELDLELYETNASDVRTKSSLEKQLKSAAMQMSFTGKTKLILVDEVDGMSATDRGGTNMVSEIIDETRFPLVMTANDAYDSKIRTLRNKSKLIKLDSVHTNSINAHLKQILEEEGIEYDESAVRRIARSANGQMRSAINDLEAVARGKTELTKEDVKAVSGRDSQKEIFQALKIIFKTMSAENAKNATQNLEEDPDTFLQWVRENIPREYKKKKDISRAYDNISKADVFNGRIRRRMNWKLLKYVYHFSSIGISLSKDEKYDGWTKYQYPSKIRKMGQSKASRNKLEEIASKLGAKLHVSRSQAVESMPFIAMLMEEDEELAKSLGLDEDEAEFVAEFS